MKGGVWLFSGSAVLFSEALHSLADVAASSFLLVGIYASQRANFSLYPFGRGRERFFWALLGAVFTLGVASTLSIVKGLDQIGKPSGITHLGIVFFVLGIDLLVNLSTVYFQTVELKEKGQSLISSIIHSQEALVKAAFIEDIMGTAGNLVGFLALLVYLRTGNLFWDGLGAVVVGLALALMSLLLISQIRSFLVGRSAPAKVQKAVSEAALSVPSVSAVRELRTMVLSPEEILVNLEVNLTDHLHTDDIEKITDQVKEAISQKVPQAKFIQVEVES